MDDLFYYSGLGLTGMAAGLLGALLGLGGGVFVVPALLLIFGMPTLTAVGASNVAVVATSTAGASQYIRNRLTNLRLALLLLISTTIAALVGSLLAGILPAPLLSGLFAVVMVYVSISMARSGKTEKVEPVDDGETDPNRDSMTDLSAEYEDGALRRKVRYTPTNVRSGMGVSAIAGMIAGLLGVGGGIVQMPVMTLLMKVPIKAATGTSNFMVGVTATGAAFVRYANGDIDPLIAVPVALSVFLGARVGAWLVPRVPTARLRSIFVYVSLAIALLMLLQAFGVYSR